MINKTWLIGILGCCISLSAVSYADSKYQLEQRLKPVGQVAVADATTPSTADKPAAATAAPSQNERIKNLYDTKCSVCHAAGVAGAPKFADKAEWKKRYDATNQKAEADQIAKLVDSAKKGKNAMPPMGTCPDCTDQDFAQLIQYMSSGELPKDAAPAPTN